MTKPNRLDSFPPGRRVRPSAIAIALVAMAASLSAGCATATNTATVASTGTQPSPGPATAGSPSPAMFVAAPCPQPNYPGNPALNFAPTVKCGNLTVPEDRRNPAGPTIRLTVARVPAVSSASQADPVVYLQGGPGESALLLAQRSIQAGINADHDVIYLEQRGNFHTEPNLECPEVEAYLAASLSKNLANPATTAEGDAATTACRNRLTAAGIDLKAYTTEENAADVADLRVAMGIDTWNVYGTSYGTDLALRVLRDHPAGIRSVVVDSVVPPNLNPLKEFWPSFSQAYQQLFAGCAAQPACAAAYPRLAEEFSATVNRLAASPQTVATTDQKGAATQVVIDGYRLANLAGIAMASGPEARTHEQPVGLVSGPRAHGGRPVPLRDVCHAGVPGRAAEARRPGVRGPDDDPDFHDVLSATEASASRSHPQEPHACVAPSRCDEQGIPRCPDFASPYSPNTTRCPFRRRHHNDQDQEPTTTRDAAGALTPNLVAVRLA